MKSLYETIFDKEASLENVILMPQSNSELKQIIDDYIKKHKPSPGEEVDLNWIDISGVDDLNAVFQKTDYIPVIDTWKIDQVKDFSYMFLDNTYITRSPIPVLQKKLLSARCYHSMFTGCSSLVEPPELPAEKLRADCYMNMFQDCTSLQVAPELPAEKLVNGCYAGMFTGCSSLQVAPELPAKELAIWCYYAMFRDCTSIVESPELPAEELANGCYNDMFADCTSLTTAPDLPAIELTKNCYGGMFQGCSSLAVKAKIPTGVKLNKNTARDMYKGCPCEKKLRY